MDVFACVGACCGADGCAGRGRGRGAADVMIGLVAYHNNTRRDGVRLLRWRPTALADGPWLSALRGNSQ